MLAALAMAVPATAPLSIRDAKREADAIITPQNLRDYLTFIASDALQGRDTPSPGLDAAAEFIAYNLKKMGAKPAGDAGTYFQSIPLTKRKADPAVSFMRVGDMPIDSGDYVAQGWGTAKAAAIYVGGSIPPSLDIKGKIVVADAVLPRAAFRVMSERGALGLIQDTGFSGDAFKGFADGFRRFSGGRFRVDDPTKVAATPEMFTFRLRHEAFTKLVEGLKVLDALVSPISLSIDGTTTKGMTQNVVAVIEGSDPTLKAEYVALGAHYDHIGIDLQKTGDQIYNGADDDGSGTVSILNIALAASSGAKPKRSLLFVWHTGEEKGLWGSEYFNNHPTVPSKSIVAQLNIDMIGRTRKAGDTNKKNANLVGENSIYVIGTTMMSTRLGEIVRNTNKDYLNVTYDPRYDDPKDPNQFFFRSDHYNYAKKGIPICFWFDGVHEDYHQVSDEISKIDFVNMSKVARTVFLTAVNVANEKERPPVNIPLNR